VRAVAAGSAARPTPLAAPRAAAPPTASATAGATSAAALTDALADEVTKEHGNVSDEVTKEDGDASDDGVLVTDGMLIDATTANVAADVAADDAASAAVVVEAAFRDPEVREAILPAKVEALRRMVEAIAGAFCSAWSGGFNELRKTSKGHGELTLLGPAAELWPQLLGVVLRLAMHLEHRLAQPSSAAAARRGAVATLPDLSLLHAPVLGARGPRRAEPRVPQPQPRPEDMCEVSMRRGPLCHRVPQSNDPQSTAKSQPSLRP